MGEIKSTMEIIMEKTKDLTMSDEEKKAIEQREVSGKMGGLIQKFIDGVIDLERLKVDMDMIGEKRQDLMAQAVLEEAIPRIRLGQDNDLILRIFEITRGIDQTAILDTLSEFNERFENRKLESKKRAAKRIAGMGISGSAVIPNPESDPEWDISVSAITKELEERLRSLNLLDATS